MADDAKLRGLLTVVAGGSGVVDAFFGGEAVKLAFADSPSVSLEWNRHGGLFAYSLLVDIPEEAEAARDLLAHVLELNLPGFLDHGCFFSAHDGMVAVFSACRYAEMEEKEFRSFLGLFAAQARELQGELNDFVSSAAGTGAGQGSDAPKPARGWIIA